MPPIWAVGRAGHARLRRSLPKTNSIDLLLPVRQLFYLHAGVFDTDTQVLQNLRCYPFTYPQQAKQNVFGADVIIVKVPRLIDSELYNLACLVSKTFKYNLCLSAKEYALIFTYLPSL